MAKSEGTEVRHAINGPDIDHDKLIGKIDKWNGEDRERASGAAETRGEIGQFTEATGINPKALSMLRTIKKAAMKDGGQAKAMDIIRSLKKGLPMIEADVAGQQSEMFPDPEEEPDVVDPEELPEDDLADDASDFEKHLAQVAG